MNYTPDQATHDYPPNLKRWQVIELGIRFGLKQGAIRTLIEGEEAVLKPRKIARQKYGYFKLEDAIRIFNPDSTTAAN